MADQSPPSRPGKDAGPAAKPVVPPVARPAIPVPPVVPKAIVVPKAVVPPAVPGSAPKAVPARSVPAAPRTEPQKPRPVVDAGGETAEPVPAEPAARARPRDPGASTAALSPPASVLEAPRPPSRTEAPRPQPARTEPAPPTPASAAKPPAPPAAPEPAASAASAPAGDAPVPAAPGPSAPVPAVAVKARTLTIARPAGPDPLIGRVVARCKIEERIGEGKTSVVYRATHTALGMKVAVKILHPEVLEFPEIVQKFENEARAIARLDHANVLKIYDVATEGDVHGIVMELLEGETVLDLLDREGRLPAVDALRIIRQSAAGLEAAHAKKIIHRDVKPQNLVVLPDGTVKLVDFGLATAPDSDMASSRIGTPHYMAPEVCEAKSAEPESDVYSLGISLFHCLVGAPPYAGKTVKEILAAHVEGKALQPEWRAPGIPKPLCDLVRDMTKRDPLTRMTMHDVIEVVDKIGGEELAASPRLSSRRSHVRAKAGAPVAAIVGGIVLLVGLLAIVLAKGGGPSKTPGPGRAPGEPPDTAAVDPGATSPPSAAGTAPATNPATPTTAPTPAEPPPPPPETEEQRKAREEKEAVARKKQAETAFKEVEDFARLHETDKLGVVRQYRQVASQFKGTDSAKEAKRRADLIDKGEMHPNPDKTFTPPDRVAEATAKWEAVRAKVDAALSSGGYAEAESLIPEAVDDPKGQLSEELVFWRRLATDCRGFLAGLKRFVPELKGKDRDIPTPKGVGRVTDANEGGLKVEVGGSAQDFRWDELARKDLLQLAARAFRNKDDAYGSMIVSFAFVHRLRDEFWQYAVGKSLSGDAAAHVSRALARADARFTK